MDKLTQQLSLMVLNSEQLVGSHVTAQYHFDLLGGTLGSSLQDDWQLQDRLGGVLAAHARIESHDGRFCLCDLSGQTYLQGITSPLGRGRKVYLQQGDEITIGPLRLRAYVGSQPASHLTQTLPSFDENRLDEWLVAVDAPPEPIPDAPHLADPLLALQQQYSPIVACSASELGSETALPLACQPAFKPTVLFSVPTAGEKRMNQECIDMPTIDSFPTVMASQSLPHQALAPLLRGLGQEGSWQESQSAHEMLEEMGRTLRATVEGLLALQAQESALADKHLRPIEDNPLRLGLTCDETLAVLFSDEKSPVHLTAPAAVAESLHNVRIHHLANQQAIGVALESLLQAFSPETLLARFARYRREPGSQMAEEGWAWSMYQHYYRELTSVRQQGFDRLFHQVYAQAYDQAVRQQQGVM